ncbi:hypothetical protein ISP17_09210 [Dyella ginsengisoli]|uniref:Uncharacterized protein n=1 Tax=Dyella ginsengisoli TaxID=363848 RepID=A0ABW8JSN6_9GAMM
MPTIFNTKHLKAVDLLTWLLVLVAPFAIAFVAFGGAGWDFSVPMVYGKYDDIWQLILTKSLLDNGWFLNNPYLGAPGIANGYFNSAAQTSSIHSVIMKVIGIFVSDSVRVQYYYYFLNFPLISFTSYISCRMLRVSRLFAVSVGILFSLSLYRLNFPYFAFISNYFMVPLAILVVIWCAKGAYLKGEAKSFKEVVLELKASGMFWLSVLIVFLMAISDGYYAFFTALLLGFASLVVVFQKRHRPFLNGLVPLFFAGLIISITLIMMIPLTQYRNAHPEEFFPGGVQDPALTIHPFEAEVYASTLKVMLTPNLNHRVHWIARLAEKMRQSGAPARKYGYGVSGQLASLASICFLLLMSVFCFPRWILENRFVNNLAEVPESGDPGQIIYILGLIAAFIFVTETMGGVGSLIALVYPFIRAYERLSIFLIFVALLAAALFLTNLLSRRVKNSPVTLLLVGIVTMIALLDQIPVNLARSMSSPDAQRFLAERTLVHEVESQLKPGAMVYQYPYAQYMAPSPYYGMGSQAQTRSYLHSHTLRWSNGASKNSAVDLWHRDLAKLGPVDLMDELVDYGFRGVLIDRWVVNDHEFAAVGDAIKSIGGRETAENSTARMAFFKLPDYGFHLQMDKDFQVPYRLVLHEDVPLDYARLPPYVDGDLLKEILQSYKGGLPKQLEFSKYPGLLDVPLYSTIVRGFVENVDQKKLLGDVDCVSQKVSDFSGPYTNIPLQLTNNSTFAWRLGAGSHPITLGYHVVDSEGAVVSWDNGFRIKSGLLLSPGKSQRVVLKIPSSDFQQYIGRDYRVVFELLQEGNAWFGVNSVNNACSMRLPPAS